MERIFLQIQNWIQIDGVREICLILKNSESNETLERWQFKIILVSDPSLEKSNKEVEAEIRALMKQISASVTFLPLIEVKSNSFFLILESFDVIVYVREEALLKDHNIIKKDWNDSEQFLINNGESVDFRHFTTKTHKVNAVVTYKLNRE